MIRRAGEDDDDGTTDDASSPRRSRSCADQLRRRSEQSIVHPLGEAFLDPQPARATS